MKKRLILAIAAAALVVVPATWAKDGDVLVRGTCTDSTTSKLKLSEEDGRIEVEFEVDQNRNGVRWSVVLRRPTTVLVRTTRVTRAPSARSSCGGWSPISRVATGSRPARRARREKCAARPRRSDQRVSESVTSSGSTIQTPSVSEIATTAKRRD